MAVVLASVMALLCVVSASSRVRTEAAHHAASGEFGRVLAHELLASHAAETTDFGDLVDRGWFRARMGRLVPCTGPRGGCGRVKHVRRTENGVAVRVHVVTNCAGACPPRHVLVEGWAPDGQRVPELHSLRAR